MRSLIIPKPWKIELNEVEILKSQPNDLEVLYLAIIQTQRILQFPKTVRYLSTKLS